MTSKSVSKNYCSIQAPLLEPNLHSSFSETEEEEEKKNCCGSSGNLLNSESFDELDELYLTSENFKKIEDDDDTEESKNKNQQKKEFNLDQIVAKLSWRVLPFLCLIICLSHLDRTNLSLAALAIFSSNTAINRMNYWLVAGVMYIGYSVFQIPNSFGVVKFGAPIWLGLQLLGWGVINVGFAFVQSLTGFVLLRFALGVLEAGYQTGIWYSASLFFPATHLTLPFAIIDVGEGVAQVFGPFVTVGLLSLGGKWQLMGWQWVFTVEGFFTILAGFTIMLALPKDLSRTRVITHQQRLFLERQMSTLEHSKSKRALVDITNTTTSSFWLALSNFKVWHLSIIRFLKTISSEGTMYWLPIIIRSMLHKDGNQKLQTIPVLLTSIPYACAYVATLFNGHHAQSCQENRYHGGVPYLVSGVCFMVFPFVQNLSDYLRFPILVGQVAGFILLVITVTGEKMSNPNLTNLVCGHSTKKEVHVALAINLTVGNLGGFVGNYGFKLFKKWTGRAELAVVFLGATLLLAGVLFLLIDEPIKQVSQQNQKNKKQNIDP
eukprot:TRINITY_DN529_c1_g1_i6.p1 TRINITY_DN529_c1_g1~~TRINITY_DN529_c1_g1_i6.p1  ORF type:complete len:579 (+),score=60.76 TRINITY_DN529_c1_g1_i6:95-1738(+)